MGGGTAEVPTGTLRWACALRSGEQITLTYQITLPTGLAYSYLYSAAFLEDGVGGAWERATWLPVEPVRVYLPLILKVSYRA
jgi:CO dehydrogenase/acetyl-CoA synthase beta subunit